MYYLSLNLEKMSNKIESEVAKLRWRKPFTNSDDLKVQVEMT